MSEYISRDWLLGHTHTGMDTIQMMQTMMDAPAADVVEVVRCADCVHCESASDGWCRCENTDAGMPLDGFCSDGERKDGADHAAD